MKEIIVQLEKKKTSFLFKLDPSCSRRIDLTGEWFRDQGHDPFLPTGTRI